MSLQTDKIANALHNANCLRFGFFKIKSGAVSPYYIDLAKLLSSPKDLSIISKITAEKIKIIMKVEKIDKLASIALKGALICPSISTLVNLPCVIIRKMEKDYGSKGRIIGAKVNEGDKILFFDDVVSEGISKIEGIEQLRKEGAIVKHLIVVVDRQQGGKEKLEQKGFIVHSLAKISEIVTYLFKAKKMSKTQAQKSLDYINRE